MIEDFHSVARLPAVVGCHPTLILLDENILDLLHKVVTTARKGKLHEPLTVTNPKILYLGAGSGIWKGDVSQESPGAEVTELLNYVYDQPSPQVRVEASDLDGQWGQGDFQGLDLIFMQLLVGAIDDDAALFRRAFRHLKPGGLIERLEIDWVVKTDDGTLPADSPLALWAQNIGLALQRQGMGLCDVAADLRAAGFGDVVEHAVDLPTSPWIDGEHEQELGRYFNLLFGHAITPLSVSSFTRVLGWSAESVDDLAEQVKRAICTLRIHAYCKMTVWTGRKPMAPKL